MLYSDWAWSSAWIALGIGGIAVRQVDRVRFTRRRGADETAPTTVPAVLERQRSHANNVTPTLVLGGHWLEIAAWWGLGAVLGPAFLVVSAVMVAVKFRHLQETSHFAAHGVLFRSLRIGDAVTELAAHAPLGFMPVPTRRERHVRRHHPNATVPGVDPNLDDLVRAGIRPGASTPAFIAGILFPLTPRGFADTVRGIAGNLRAGGPWRVLLFLAVPTAAYAVGGLPGLIAGYIVPRLFIYPQLAWMSLLVEHTWFDNAPSSARTGIGAGAGIDASVGADIGVGAGKIETETKAALGKVETETTVRKIEIEAARCIRLYRGRPVAELLARSLWLPYGDLYHFAHSAHPSVRWNYLRLVDELLGSPGRAAGHVVFGKDSVLACLRRVTAPSSALRLPRAPVRSPISAQRTP